VLAILEKFKGFDKNCS